ncbi:MAG: DHHA1 domain-containing protein, partial [Bacteroidota bacterium]
TKKENDLIVHFTEKGDFTQVEDLGQLEFLAQINLPKRRLTENNHSATHLMHSALRQVLGSHVEQRGSLVNDKILRFDFSHATKMTEEEIDQVEKMVNEKIRENIPLDEQRNVPFQKATEEMNATGLFGEKYGEFVRVITFDEDYSRELCGGTHVPATGKIGLFKIVTETSSSAGVRRIEAITAEVAENYVREQLYLISEIKELLKQPKDLRKAISGLLDEKNQLHKEIESYQQQEVKRVRKELAENIEQKNGINFIKARVSLPSADALKNLVYDLKANTENLFAILAADIKGKPQVAVMISDHLVQEKDLHAGKIVKELAKSIKGGGGGQPFFATAGGKDLSGLDQVLQKASDF